MLLKSNLIRPHLEGQCHVLLLVTHCSLFTVVPIYIEKFSPWEGRLAFGELLALMSKRLCKAFLRMLCIYLGSKYSEYINPDPEHMD